MPNIVPLTLREQKDREERVLRKSQNKEKSKSWEGSRKNGGSSKIKSTKQSESKGKGKSGSRADYSGNNEEWMNNEESDGMQEEPRSLLDGFEFYPRAFMDFEIFEIEVFVKPQFKPANPDIWTGIG
jgi:hypothetical protein